MVSWAAETAEDRARLMLGFVLVMVFVVVAAAAAVVVRAAVLAVAADF